MRDYAHPENHADNSGRRIALGTVMTSLPALQREAVEQLALMGRSLVEASFATGLSRGALKVNLHRALNSLRARVSNAQ